MREPGGCQYWWLMALRASPLQLRTIEDGWWLHCGQGKSGKKATSAVGGRSGGFAAEGGDGFAKVGAHEEKELAEFEGLAEEEASVEAHAVELPVMATCDDDDRGMASAVVAAQNFVEGSAIEVGKADVEEDEVWVKRGYVATGDVSVVEEGELPVRKVFEGIAKKFGEWDRLRRWQCA